MGWLYAQDLKAGDIFSFLLQAPFSLVPKHASCPKGGVVAIRLLLLCNSKVTLNLTKGVCQAEKSTGSKITQQ